MHKFSNFKHEIIQVWISWFLKFLIAVVTLSLVRLPELKLIELFTIIIPMCAGIAMVFAVIYAAQFLIHHKAGKLGKLLTKRFL